MILIMLAIAATTLLGGLIALSFRDKLHLILGFSAGAVVAVALFDLLPESIALSSQSYSISLIMLLVVCGFVGYMLIDRFSHLHTHTHDDNIDCNNTNHTRPASWAIIGISVHSLLDGIAIGLAYQVSPAVGIVIAIAVLAHVFSDGMNTVGLAMRGNVSLKNAFRWLALDAIAPSIGIIISLFITLPKDTLGLVLAVFSGFFLYLGASDLLPESHHRHPTVWTTIMSLLGMIIIYIAVRLSGF